MPKAKHSNKPWIDNDKSIINALNFLFLMDISSDIELIL